MRLPGTIGSIEMLDALTAEIAHLRQQIDDHLDRLIVITVSMRWVSLYPLITTKGMPPHLERLTKRGTAGVATC